MARTLLVAILVAHFVFVSSELQLERRRVEISSSPCDGSLFSLQPPENSTTETLHITALFPFQGDFNGHHFVPAALLALDEINNRSDLLPGYHLQMDIRNTECDPTQGNYQLVKSVEASRSESEAPRLAILGPGCADVSESFAGVSGLLFLPAVSYSYNPPGLSVQRSDLPQRERPFFQTVRNTDQSLQSALAVVAHFGWVNQIAFVYEDDGDFSTSVVNLEDQTFQVPKSNDTIQIELFRQLLKEVDSCDVAGVKSFVDDVRDNELRVILGLVSEQTAYELLCKAQNGTRPRDFFVWVFVGIFDEDWWRSNRTCNLGISDVESVLIVSGEVQNNNESAVLQTSGNTYSDFDNAYQERLEQWCPGANPEPFYTTAYDSVWTIAIALNSTIEVLTSFSSPFEYQYQDTEVFRTTLRSIESTDFIGASGRVRFEENGERKGRDIVFQIQNGTRTVIGFYDDRLEIDAIATMWPGNTTPSDVPIQVNKTIAAPILAFGIALTSVGLVASFVAFFFNWYYGAHRILRASSQQLNYVILVGVWFGYLTVILFSILESNAGEMLDDESYKAICLIRLWMLVLTPTLAYGVMFARAWRVYRIFNNPFITRRSYLKDYHLLGIVGFIALGDILLLIPWTIIDPHRRYPSEGPVDYDRYQRCVSFSCSGDFLVYWLGVMAILKLLLLVAGVIVVTLVREGVDRKIYDDSKSLKIAIYTISICFMVGLPVQVIFLQQLQVVLSYIAGVVWVNLAMGSILLTIFAHKFWKIVIMKDKARDYHSAKSLFDNTRGLKRPRGRLARIYKQSRIDLFRSQQSIL